MKRLSVIIVVVFLLLLFPRCSTPDATSIDLAFLEQAVLQADDVQKLKLKKETCYVYLKESSLTKPEHQRASNGVAGPHYQLDFINQQQQFEELVNAYELHYSKSIPIKDSRITEAVLMQLSFSELIIGFWILNLILLVAALVTILKNEFKESSNKIIWVILVLFAPLLGPILFFVIGRSQIKRSTNV